MKRNCLDKIDKNILRRLQSDGRITNLELSKNVGISAPPCLRRVRALEKLGYIKGYNAKIDSNSMGYGVTVFALVTLDTQAAEEVAQFEEYISNISMVRDCYVIAGDVDFILKIVAKSWENYQTLLENELRSAPNVKVIKSMLTFSKSKNEYGIPID